MLRIGMLTPSSNTVLEPMTSAMLADLSGVSVHFSRFKVVEIGLDAAAVAQFDSEPVLRAAELLAHAKVDVIAWNGTSAAWLGLEHDRKLVERIQQSTGVQACTCVLGLQDILVMGEIREIGLVSPYTTDVQARIVSQLAQREVQCVAERHLGLRDNFAFAEVQEQQISSMISDVSASNPQAVVVLCTNLAGARLAPRLEGATGPIILDSVSITLWTAMRKIGFPPAALSGWGRLFSERRLQ